MAGMRTIKAQLNKLINNEKKKVMKCKKDYEAPFEVQEN